MYLQQVDSECDAYTQLVTLATNAVTQGKYHLYIKLHNERCIYKKLIL